MYARTILQKLSLLLYIHRTHTCGILLFSASICYPCDGAIVCIAFFYGSSTQYNVRLNFLTRTWRADMFTVWQLPPDSWIHYFHSIPTKWKSFVCSSSYRQSRRVTSRTKTFSCVNSMYECISRYLYAILVLFQCVYETVQMLFIRMYGRYNGTSIYTQSRCQNVGCIKYVIGLW